PVTRASRAEEANGKTSPAEVTAAAHSSCLAMASCNTLGKAGHPPPGVSASADDPFRPGEGITAIHLTLAGAVPSLDDAAFLAAPEDAKVNCPVSQALKGTEISRTAKLA